MLLLVHKPFRDGFARRCVGEATAIDLAYIRIVVASVLIVYVSLEPIASQAELGPDWFSPLGFAKPLGGLFTWFLSSALRLTLLKVGVLVGLLLVLLGVATRITLPVTAVLYFLFAGLLRSFGKNFHEGYLSFYVLLILCFLPCADAWSFDARLRRRRRGQSGSTADDPPAYNWAVWACYATVSIPYLQLAFSKLIKGGWFWFDGRSLRNYMVVDNLNLSHANFDLGLRFHDAPVILFTIGGFFAVFVELLYPAVVVVPRLRRVLPLCIAFLHLGIWFGQDALFIDAVLVPAFLFLRPSRWSWVQRQA